MLNISIITSNPYISIGFSGLSLLIILILFFIKKPNENSILSYYGRIGRLTFIKIILLSIVIEAIPIILITYDIIGNIYVATILYVIFCQLAFILELKASVRRLHDLNLSYWLYIVQWIFNANHMTLLGIPALSSFSGLFFIYLCLKKGKDNAPSVVAIK